MAIRRQFFTVLGITQVAEFFQLSLGWEALRALSQAQTAKSSAQRQSLREGPKNGAAFFGREEIGTSHDSHILVRIGLNVLDFFHA